MRRTQLIISLSALLIALAHLIFPDVAIEGITVTLLAIAVLPWLGPLFKAIELPGGLKVEYQDLLKTEKRAEEAGLLAPERKSAGQPRHVYAFEAVAQNDLNLALAGLRIEIESRLRDIAGSKGITSDNKSADRILRELRARGHLSQGDAAVIEDLLPLLSRAAHGAQVDERGSQWALDSGIRILHALQFLMPLAIEELEQNLRTASTVLGSQWIAERKVDPQGTGNAGMPNGSSFASSRALRARLAKVSGFCSRLVHSVRPHEEPYSSPAPIHDFGQVENF